MAKTPAADVSGRTECFSLLNHWSGKSASNLQLLRSVQFRRQCVVNRYTEPVCATAGDHLYSPE